jgi:hypothetical protein
VLRDRTVPVPLLVSSEETDADEVVALIMSLESQLQVGVLSLESTRKLLGEHPQEDSLGCRGHVLTRQDDDQSAANLTS